MKTFFGESVYTPNLKRISQSIQNQSSKPGSYEITQIIKTLPSPISINVDDIRIKTILTVKCDENEVS